MFELLDSRYDLALSDNEFTMLISKSRLANVNSNLERFGFLAASIITADDMKAESLHAILAGQPSLLSLSGQNALHDLLPLLEDSQALISEFLCWQYVSNFTPLDFTPPENWRDVLYLFEDNETKRLLEAGYADSLFQLRQAVPDDTVEALIAYETVLALRFRPRIPSKNPAFYSHPRVLISPGDTVLDCGACANAYGGQFVTDFATLCQPAGKVIAFEPMHEVFQALEADVADIFNVVLVNAAVWSRPTTLTFAADGIQSRKLLESEEQPASASDLSLMASHVSVRAERIDDLDAEQPINFIKMDVEGAEYDALLGAQSIIQRDKPKLSICLYHSPADFVRIPKLIHEFCPEYKMWIELNEGHSWAGMKLFASVE